MDVARLTDGFDVLAVGLELLGREHVADLIDVGFRDAPGLEPEFGRERVAVDRRPNPDLVVVDELGEVDGVESLAPVVRPVMGEFVVAVLLQVAGLNEAVAVFGDPVAVVFRTSIRWFGVTRKSTLLVSISTISSR